MQLTPNYKLKKPEGTDPVDIQDFNDNADLIDAALKKKAESSGGDISGMTVKTLDDITTEFPVPVAGESTKTFLGKVKKFFSDTKNWMTGVCLIGQIVNNCVTNNAKLPLSAAQGKMLMDLYTVLNTNLINPLLVRTFAYAQTITLAPNDGQEIQIPITVPEGYIFLCVTNVKSNGEIAYSYCTRSASNVLTCFVGNDRNKQKIIPQGISADVLFMKKCFFSL